MEAEGAQRCSGPARLTVSTAPSCPEAPKPGSQAFSLGQEQRPQLPVSAGRTAGFTLGGIFTPTYTQACKAAPQVTDQIKPGSQALHEGWHQGPSCHSPTPPGGPPAGRTPVAHGWILGGGRRGYAPSKQEGRWEVWPSGHRVGTTRLGGLEWWGSWSPLWVDKPSHSRGVSGLTPPRPCSVGSWTQTRGGRGATYNGTSATCPLPRAGRTASLPSTTEVSAGPRGETQVPPAEESLPALALGSGTNGRTVPESSERVCPLRPPRGSRSH